MTHAPANGRLLPTFLILICLMPIAAGLYRITELVFFTPWVFEFARDHVDMVPLLLHIIGGLSFLVLGAIQILPGTRRRNPRWHRRSGKLAIVMGLLGALSGLWMTLFHSEISGGLLYSGRIASSTFWAVAILVSLYMIYRRNFAAHGRWMLRAYAIALPAGTLAFVLFPMVLILGEEGFEFLFEIVQVVAWPLHLAIVERIIRRKPRRRAPLAINHPIPQGA